jgi:hypothetical protein
MRAWLGNIGKAARLIGMPRRCFVSHAYVDQPAIKALRERLPGWVKPIIFPPQDVSAYSRVSDELIKEIRMHPGLIFLSSHLSANSAWVAFERDYAIRMRKKVYEFDPEQRTLQRYHHALPALQTFGIYSRADRTEVRTIARFMKDQRNFDLLLLGEDKTRTNEAVLSSRLEAGGFCVVFLSHPGIKMPEWSWDLVFHATQRWPERMLVRLALGPAKSILLRSPCAI